MRPTRRKPSKVLRRDIAHAAARIVAEGGADSFAAAKRKAAAHMGFDNLRHLPDNVEVHAALIEYLRLFEGERLEIRIDSMRREARAAMRILAQFSPRLVGPVLYGSACEHSPVTLHLYSDELESVTRFLHERKIHYLLTDISLKTSPKRREAFPTYVVTNNGLEFELVVFPLAFLTHPPLSALDGRPYKRADTAAVEELIENKPALNAPTVEAYKDPTYGEF